MLTAEPPQFNQNHSYKGSDKRFRKPHVRLRRRCIRAPKRTRKRHTESDSERYAQGSDVSYLHCHDYFAFDFRSLRFGLAFGSGLTCSTS